MDIRLGRELLTDLQRMQTRIASWSTEGQKRLERAYKRITLAWMAGAERRVPIDESRLAQSLLNNVYWDAGLVLTGEVGTNVKEYPVHLEFGTKWIARGRVKRLGLDPDITDLQAIHMWPAKAADATDGTSVSLVGAGVNAGRLRSRTGQLLKRKPQEQMPWLRPSFVAIRDWAIEQIEDALEPPN